MFDLGFDEEQYEKVLLEMKKLLSSRDTESAHSKADKLLTQFLTDIGAVELVTAYDKIKKYYA